MALKQELEISKFTFDNCQSPAKDLFGLMKVWYGHAHIYPATILEVLLPVSHRMLTDTNLLGSFFNMAPTLV